MKKNILLLFFLTLLSACVTNDKSVVAPLQKIENSNIANSVTAQQSDKFRVIIPRNNWGFAFKTIDERAANSRLSDLRSKPLPKNDIEVRIWAGFGLGVLQGFVLRRADGEWSATDLILKGYKNRKGQYNYKPIDKKLDAPKIGWDTAWAKLVDAGILTLPDVDEINCSGETNDGVVYVIEYNADNVYRTYTYDNPQNAECAEAKQMMKIDRIIAEDYLNLELKTESEN